MSKSGLTSPERRVRVVRGEAGLARGEDVGEIELILAGPLLDERVEDLVQDLGGPGIGPVDLVDHHDRPDVAGKRLAQHELGLRHRPFEGVDQDQGPVGHLEGPLDLAAEIGVAGRVDQVDLDVAVLDRDVLGQDGDAALPLQVVGVEDPLALELRCPVLAGLAEHGVDQGRLAVVDVGYDGHVSDVVASLHGSLAAAFGRVRLDPSRAIRRRFHPVRQESSILSMTPHPDKAACHGTCMMDTSDISQFLGMLVVILAGGQGCRAPGAAARAAGGPGRADRRRPGRTVGAGLGRSRARDDPSPLRAGCRDPAVRDRPRDRSGPAVKVGATSLTVAVVGVALPFALGFAACRLLGLSTVVSIMAAATLTATSVGITARVLSDLGRLHEPEGQIILGAAVIDDILGLLILTARGRAGRRSGGLVAGDPADDRRAPSASWWPPSWSERMSFPSSSAGRAGSSCRARRRRWRSIAAFGLAWLADRCGSAMIIGAFAAGLLVVRAPQSHEIERGITEIGHFFVPLFFVAVGASVDLSALEPARAREPPSLCSSAGPDRRRVAGKLAAGYAPFWFRGNKTVIGVGMIPRGEVGLIFAQAGSLPGLRRRPLRRVTLMVIVTTLVAPPSSSTCSVPPSHPRSKSRSKAIEDLVNEA